ncbi:MAG: right-handed parallel beta-helix repeat-containing protein [Lentisphaeria bacterium]|nr:right-handed parallel beta-helix repeat-containing protein [Lentisphaeria bacterium]
MNCGATRKTVCLILIAVVMPNVKSEDTLDKMLRRREADCARAILDRVRVPDVAPAKDACSVTRYRELVRTDTWQEVWPKEGGGEQTISVTAEVWTAAIRVALRENKIVRIEHRLKPYYIDAPLILKSGQQLVVDPKAEIRLKPGSNCCMVRNEHLANGHAGPVELAADADHDIVITGGIWTTLATNQRRQSNGNTRGLADPKGALPSHGVILLNSVRSVRVSGVTIRECRPHGVQISNCSQFLVEDIRFQNHRRDGVHVNGPASYGVIREIRNAQGVMGDDMLALNAWDWKNTVMTFGPIHHLLVENVDGSPVAESDTGKRGKQGEHRSEIRLLAGTKHFGAGNTLDCTIEDCVIRGVAGIRTFKMYDQPNLELGRTVDFADPIGNMKNLFFSDVRVDRRIGAALFQIHSNVDGLTIRDVRLGFAPKREGGKSFTLVAIGPVSQTYKFDKNDPNRWVEVFSPDKDCTVKGLHIASVRSANGTDGKESGRRIAADELVRVIQQTVNPNYPKSTPKGGTGQGRLEDLNGRPFVQLPEPVPARRGLRWQSGGRPPYKARPRPIRSLTARLTTVTLIRPRG